MENRGMAEVVRRFLSARRSGDRDETRAALYKLVAHVPLRGPDRERYLLDSVVGRFFQVFTSPEAASSAQLPDISEIRTERVVDLARTATGDNAGLVIDPGLPGETFLPTEALPALVEMFEADTLGQFAAPDVVGVSGQRFGGFPFAASVDGLDDQGRPRVHPSRVRPLPGSGRAAILDYLDSAPVLQAPLELGVDLFDPDRGKVVPLGWRTDGTWIWSDSASYYLREYGLEPAGLREHVRGRGGTCPEVGEQDRADATRALRIRNRRAGGPSPFGGRPGMAKAPSTFYAVRRDEVVDWYFLEKDGVVLDTRPQVLGQLENARILLFHAAADRGRRFCEIHDEAVRFEPAEWRGDQVARFAAELAPIPPADQVGTTGFWALDDDTVDLLSDELPIAEGLWRAPRELRRRAVEAEIHNAWTMRWWFEHAVELDCDVALVAD